MACTCRDAASACGTCLAFGPRGGGDGGAVHKGEFRLTGRADQEMMVLEMWVTEEIMDLLASVATQRDEMVGPLVRQALLLGLRALGEAEG